MKGREVGLKKVKMKELSFNQIKNKIHLKKVEYSIIKKVSKEIKTKQYDKLTFYKDYKSKMLWLSGYGLGLENLKFYEIEENKIYLIETDKSMVKIYLEGGY